MGFYGGRGKGSSFYIYPKPTYLPTIDIDLRSGD